jgi:hypothetical protein
MSPLTHDFLGKALEVWRQTAPGIVVDCVEMDSVSQERALLESRISAAASQFVDGLAQTCAMENGESRAPEIELKQLGSRAAGHSQLERLCWHRLAVSGVEARQALLA